MEEKTTTAAARQGGCERENRGDTVATVSARVDVPPTDAKQIKVTSSSRKTFYGFAITSTTNAATSSVCGPVRSSRRFSLFRANRTGRIRFKFPRAFLSAGRERDSKISPRHARVSKKIDFTTRDPIYSNLSFVSRDPKRDRTFSIVVFIRNVVRVSSSDRPNTATAGLPDRGTRRSRLIGYNL